MRTVEIAFSGEKIFSATLIRSVQGQVIRPSIDIYKMGHGVA